MKFSLYFFGLMAAAIFYISFQNRGIPMAKKIDKTLSIHGHQRQDPYYWLNERDNPEVIAYLNQENDYTKRQLKHTESLQNQLYTEMKSRIKENESTLPYKKGSYYYYSRYKAGAEYPIYCRKKTTLDAPEQVILDVNRLAKGHSYYNIGALSVSPDERYLAYAVDTQSRRIYSIHFKDLVSDQKLPDEIKQVTGDIAWANDSQTLFYASQDPETLRSDKIYRHQLGNNQEQLIYFEKDETFSTYISRTLSGKFLVISSHSTLTSEAYILEADTPTAEFRLFEARKRGHEYHVFHGGDRFYVLSNHQAKNFRIFETQQSSTNLKDWDEVIAHRSDVLISDMAVFADHFVIEGYKGGLTQLEVYNRKAARLTDLQFEEPAYSVALGTNKEYKTSTLRYGYESMTTPDSIFDYDFQTTQHDLRKQQTVVGSFNKNDYTSERIFATAEDGTQIPISLVYKNGLEKNSANPTLLYGYGSYGMSMDPYFSSARLSLLDRGFVYAIAHIRGGSEMGRDWYENGKLLKKMNTFTDFNSCAEQLISMNYTAQNHLYAMGGSAGGLLMGAVMNLRPDLYKGLIASVPFVDVVTTMLDESIPLTTSEFDEWGNPKDKEYYDYMLSYSPYDNVEAKNYPNLLVLTGLHDSQVQYFEPAKWVAKLRELKTDQNKLLLRVNMDTGHSGASGRYEYLKEVALEYSFLLDLEKQGLL
jgi:oligopeptidase B